MKPGRNQPCYCGSGKKYKKCHGDSPNSIFEKTIDSAIEIKFAQIQAKEQQRQLQQGMGKPIISANFKDYKIVAVGNSVHYSKSWKTFHDFLGNYIKKVFGGEWGNQEIVKPLEDRHPVLQWYEAICQQQKKYLSKAGDIHSAPMTGAASAYLGLAYNLYLLEHNIELQDEMVKRLKNKDLFLGAYYETCVAAHFIKSGFDIELEDEDAPTLSHCEFVATHKETLRKFSVEAKARMPGKEHGKINKQLKNALKKSAKYERIIFIDVNAPEKITDLESSIYMMEAIKDLRLAESNLTTAPPAYVILTNHPFIYNLEEADSGRAAIADGFKIPDFHFDSTFKNLRAALDSRERHKELFHLMRSFTEHNNIPSTFDGENPEVAFGNLQDRLTIGSKYIVKNEHGNDIEAILEDVCVYPDSYRIMCVYRTLDGAPIIASDQLSEAEVAAYNAHPDTFFGVIKKQDNRIDDPIEMYDFFYKTYS